jgi:hypothetical protein
MKPMDSKHEGPFATALARLWPSGQTSDPRPRTTGEFEPGSLRTLVLLVVACWAVIGLAFWVLSS